MGPSVPLRTQFSRVLASVGCAAPHVWLNFRPKEAKADIVDNDRSKLQLESDVRLLYNLLERAKKERRSYDVTIRQLDRSLAASNARAIEVSAGSSRGCRMTFS